jgi:hypothetical protein
MGIGDILPDHQLIITTALHMVGIRREDVIRDVGAYTGRVVPVDRRRHATDLADLAALGNLSTSVDITLDVIQSAMPSPGSAPSNTAVTCAVEVRALRSRAGEVLAP